jgi:hypothetical protein
MDECRGTWGSYVYYGSICVFKWGTTACQVIIYTIEQYVCLYMGKGGGGHIAVHIKLGSFLWKFADIPW